METIKKKEKSDLIRNKEYQRCLECKRKAEEVLQEIFQTRAKENTFWSKRYSEEMTRLNILNDKIKKFEQDDEQEIEFKPTIQDIEVMQDAGERPRV